MKYFTEKEQLIHQQHFTFRLRNLYYQDVNRFNDTVEYLPMFIQINETASRDIIFNNRSIFESYREADNLVKYGFSYLPKISCPFLFENLQKKHQIFISKNDDSVLCSYPQKISMNGNLSLILSNKMLLNSDSYMVISNIAKDLNGFGRIYEEIFIELTKDSLSWLQFMSLTKTQKIIIKHLASGYSNQKISDKLCISKHTVVTHRKNIYRKLDIDNVMQLVKFALALEVL